MKVKMAKRLMGSNDVSGIEVPIVTLRIRTQRACCSRDLLRASLMRLATPDRNAAVGRKNTEVCPAAPEVERQLPGFAGDVGY
jgi:hypothetical protein